MSNTWIHERQDWPNFRWDAEAISLALADIRYCQGRLLGRMESIGFHLRQEASLETLTNDIVKSSAIEGENLDRMEVRSSIASQLGLDVGGMVPVSRHIDGVVEMMLDATRNHAMPLTEERLFGWHAALFPTGRSGMHRILVGGWRPAEAGPMQVISGPIGNENVHFEAPDATRLQTEMQSFLFWFESKGSLDPVLKAGIAHLWFVTIHPFEDGNGRIARAICDMALARADGLPDRFYSLSTQIERERKDYYIYLEKQQRGDLDITGWLGWILNCLGHALSNAETALGHILYKAQLWNHIKSNPISDRQRQIINRMLDDRWEGYMNTSKYAKLADCSNDTALRDIRTLLEWDIFVQNEGGGRSTSYRLVGQKELSS
ncbi:Fic family protein [Cohaesibacter marisflavi]|uniref:Fic family protein n=1 Tax=Cohaesibacter marisflavi TaxID=655353 RepID=A0A1I5NE51_9HYPH|nr:Fic family protein [Cohaesibacter marisflavi]SFP20049.1 Fic family protein [Cohaesibacter marisflavi]